MAQWLRNPLTLALLFVCLMLTAQSYPRDSRPKRTEWLQRTIYIVPVRAVPMKTVLDESEPATTIAPRVTYLMRQP
jgi:hypothetical protein